MEGDTNKDVLSKRIMQDYVRLREEAEALAGGLTDLAQRASVYHHLYAHSRGNHAFPLLAAHGAMWARGYFASGMLAGKVLATRMIGNPEVRQNRLIQLAAFADAFRDINRRVCIETYAAYHFTQRYGHTAEAVAVVPRQLLDQLNACHAANHEGRVFSANERRRLFEAFFLWEQDCIVGPAVERAIEAFDWPELYWLAMRPRIAFAYIPRMRQFRFRDFSSKTERIMRGLQAFEIAEAIGWKRTEAALSHYGVLPDALFENAADYFERLKSKVLAGAKDNTLLSFAN